MLYSCTKLAIIGDAVDDVCDYHVVTCCQQQQLLEILAILWARPAGLRLCQVHVKYSLLHLYEKDNKYFFGSVR